MEMSPALTVKLKPLRGSAPGREPAPSQSIRILLPLKTWSSPIPFPNDFRHPFKPRELVTIGEFCCNACPTGGTNGG